MRIEAEGLPVKMVTYQTILIGALFTRPSILSPFLRYDIHTGTVYGSNNAILPRIPAWFRFFALLGLVTVAL